VIGRPSAAEFRRSVSAEPSHATHLEIDLSGKVRGDYATGWTPNTSAVGSAYLPLAPWVSTDRYPIPQRTFKCLPRFRA
jgi:hypothetical protein